MKTNVIIKFYIAVVCLLEVRVASRVLSQNECAIPVFRPDYQFYPEQSAYYKMHQEGKSWTQAFFTCESEGAQLVVPETSAEVHLLSGLQQGLVDSSQGAFIGVHDMYLKGSFVTVDGRVLSDVWSDWKDAQSEDVDQAKDCVVLLPEGKLNDEQCSANLPFVCKKSLATATTESIPKCNTNDTDYLLDRKTNKCYKFNVQPKNWIDAVTTCHYEGSYLAIINSDYEAKLFVDLFAKYPENILSSDFQRNCIYVGFHDQFKNGIYLDIKGEPLTESGYYRWEVNQPDNNAGREHCGSMFRSGLLNDLPCDVRALFICERDAI